MGLTHMLDMGSGEFESEQIGSFFSFAKAADEFGVSLIGEARIPKRNPRLCETLLAMYNAGTLSFSFEILVNEMVERDGMLIIDAAEGNELIGMAVVSTPAYPEATALKLVAENKYEEEPKTMDENLKRIAELEAKLKLAEEQAKDKDKEDELKKKEEELEEAAAKKKECEAELAQAQLALTDKETALAEKDATIAERDARIAELDAQIAELTPFKAEVETLKAEKAAAELAAKQQELTAFAEAQGLDVAAETVAAAIKGVDYAALIAEVSKQNKKNETKPVVASYAMTNGLPAKGEYGDLLDKA